MAANIAFAAATISSETSQDCGHAVCRAASDISSTSSNSEDLPGESGALLRHVDKQVQGRDTSHAVRNVASSGEHLSLVVCRARPV